MKIRLSSIVFLFTLVTSAAAQTTVADVAREYRKGKSSNARVMTNESLALKSASSDSSMVAASSGSAASQPEAKPADKAVDDTAEGKQKLAEEFKGKIEAKKSEIAQLQRELDVSVRENKLRAATFYADAGNRLRDSQKYADDDKKYQAELAQKQRAIADAQQALEKVRDEARRAGVPAGQIP